MNTTQSKIKEAVDFIAWRIKSINNRKHELETENATLVAALDIANNNIKRLQAQQQKCEDAQKQMRAAFEKRKKQAALDEVYITSLKKLLEDNNISYAGYIIDKSTIVSLEFLVNTMPVKDQTTLEYSI